MAIEKANKQARQELIEVPLIGDTVCHEQTGEHKSSEVLIKPAAPGTGVKAGSTVRAIMQVLGVHNVLTKSLGRNNPLNLAKATMDALQRTQSVSEVERLRGVDIELSHPQWETEEEEEAPAPSGEEVSEERPEEKEADEKKEEAVAEEPVEAETNEELEDADTAEEPQEETESPAADTDDAAEAGSEEPQETDSKPKETD
jgi:hypothetical protein